MGNNSEKLFPCSLGLQASSRGYRTNISLAVLTFEASVSRKIKTPLARLSPFELVPDHEVEFW